MKKLYYEWSDLEKFISQLQNEHGYTCTQTWCGVLGIGNWVCCPPDETKYFFVIHEEYANEWSSKHWMMKCRKLPKKWQKELDDFLNKEEEYE